MSSIAEIQIDGGLRNRLAIKAADPAAPLAGMLDFEGESTSDFEDIVIGAKVRFMAETPQRPAMAVRFSTRLPNAGQRKRPRPGHDRLSLRAVDRQNGAVGARRGQRRLRHSRRSRRAGIARTTCSTYGVSVARAVATGVEVVGELNGRANTRSGTPPLGTDSRSVMRVGARFTRGPVRADGALLIGVTERDPTWGFTGGVTWVFKAFTVQ